MSRFERPKLANAAFHRDGLHNLQLFRNLHPLSRVGLFAFGAAAFTFFLFQKKMLPKSVSKVISSLFFVPTFPFTVLLRLNNYWTPIDDTVILGTAPVGFLGHPEKLHKLGVRSVINMCTEYSGPTSYYSTLGIKQLRLPTVDHFEPSVEYMQQAVDYIKAAKERNEKVYVHCKAGHGRAASIALCWLLAQNPTLSAKDANELLVSKRKVRSTLYKQPNVMQFDELRLKTTPVVTN